MPRSSAATVNRFSPDAPGRRTSPPSRPRTASSAPAISPDARTRSSSAAGSVSVEEMPTRIAPRSRRCRVSARVSMPEMPTTPCARSSSSRLRRERQLRRAPGGVADDVPGHPDPVGLRVLVVDAGVADVRSRHHDDLAVVRRVGERLLVAGHAGVEDRLAEGLPLGAVRLAAEGAAVLEDQQCRLLAGRSCELPVEHGGLAAQERRDHPPGQLHAAVRRVAAQAAPTPTGRSVRVAAGS